MAGSTVPGCVDMGGIDDDFHGAALPPAERNEKDETVSQRARLRRPRASFRAIQAAIRRDPLPWFLGVVVIVYVGIFLQQLLLAVQIRLSVYLFESALVFFLPLLLIRSGVRKLSSRSDRWDVMIFALLAGGVLLANLFFATEIGLSPRLGFVDASVILVAFFFLFYGRRRFGNFTLPIVLVVVFVAIVFLVSNENKAFIDLVGKYFITFTVWTGAGLLSVFGTDVTIGSGSYVIHGVSSLRVEVGIRCAGLDVALIYSLILAAFLSQTRGRARKKAALLAVAVLGAILLNSLRVSVLTLVYQHYGLSLGDLVHSHLGDFMFLVYVAAFWWGARRALG